MKWKMAFFLVLLALFQSGCQTRTEVRREQELERIKHEVKEIRSDRADLDQFQEEMKTELARLSSVIEDHYKKTKSENEELKASIHSLANRVQVLESKITAEPAATKIEKPKASFEQGKKLFDEGRYEEAVEILRASLKNRPSNEEAKKAHFMIAESYFQNKDYASAALEFAEYRKAHPKEVNVPNAIYRQAQSFRNMGKSKEARLFYQELLERYPKNVLVQKAKLEMKRLK
ncbi:MAG: tetratricopeptide repeat protein [Deltaproteobacteria bacterium]|nr:tetratricopeptide repeat protein [Deltaproteobacteria bacterium]